MTGGIGLFVAVPELGLIPKVAVGMAKMVFVHKVALPEVGRVPEVALLKVGSIGTMRRMGIRIIPCHHCCTEKRQAQTQG
jgi:hypothetical protein